MTGRDQAIGDLVRIIAALMGRAGTSSVEFTLDELAAVPADTALAVQRVERFMADAATVVVELRDGAAVDAAPTLLPKPDPADRLPRVRNPRIGCEWVHGTWIHGRPHDCPASARGARP